MQSAASSLNNKLQSDFRGVLYILNILARQEFPICKWRLEASHPKTMFGPVLSIGFLNVVLKIIVLSVVAFAGKAAYECVKLLICIRLQARGNAPFAFDSDGTLFKMMSTLKRMGRISCVGLLGVVILSFSMFPAEMVMDFGVFASDKCKPEQLITYGICGLVTVTRNSQSKEIATAFLVEDMPWDKEIMRKNPIYQGLRKTVDGSEYFGDSVDRNQSLPVSISNCSVSNVRKYSDAIELTFGPSRKMTAEGIGFLSASAVNGNETFDSGGYGGICDNYQFRSGFLVVRHPNNKADGSSTATVVEYPDSDHLSIIQMRALDSRNKYTVKARTPLLIYKVRCGISSLTGRNFHAAIFSFRYAQLMHSAKRNALEVITLNLGGQIVKTPRLLDGGDVVKAVLAAKIQEPITCKGETFVYTECGDFKLKLAMPLIFVVVVLVFIYAILKAKVSTYKERIRTPMTATAWAKYALSLASKETKYCSLDSMDYKVNYQQYAERSFMGEYIRKSGESHAYFELRSIHFGNPGDFIRPSEQRQASHRSNQSVKEE